MTIDSSLLVIGLLAGWFVAFIPQILMAYERYGKWRFGLCLAGTLIFGIMIGYFANRERYRFYTGENGAIMYRCNLNTGKTEISFVGKPFSEVKDQ